MRGCKIINCSSWNGIKCTDVAPICRMRSIDNYLADKEAAIKELKEQVIDFGVIILDRDNNIIPELQRQIAALTDKLLKKESHDKPSGLVHKDYHEEVVENLTAKNKRLEEAIDRLRDLCIECVEGCKEITSRVRGGS